MYVSVHGVINWPFFFLTTKVAPEGSCIAESPKAKPTYHDLERPGPLVRAGLGEMTSQLLHAAGSMHPLAGCNRSAATVIAAHSSGVAI